MSNRPHKLTPEDEREKRSIEYGELIRVATGESDRGLVITTAAHIEIYLERILRAFLIEGKDTDAMFEGPYAPYGSLSAKTKAAYVMGLISELEARQIDAVRKVRNVFAHELTASFEHPKVQKLCGKEPINDGRLNDRDAFLHMAMNTAISIVYRDYGVATKLKRQPFTVATRHQLDRASIGKKLK